MNQDIFRKLANDMKTEHQKIVNAAKMYQDLTVNLLEILKVEHEEIKAMEDAAIIDHDFPCSCCTAIERAELALNRFKV